MRHRVFAVFLRGNAIVVEEWNKKVPAGISVCTDLARQAERGAYLIIEGKLGRSSWKEVKGSCGDIWELKGAPGTKCLLLEPDAELTVRFGILEATLRYDEGEVDVLGPDNVDPDPDPNDGEPIFEFVMGRVTRMRPLGNGQARG